MPTFLLGREIEARQNGCNRLVSFSSGHLATSAQHRYERKN
jgi:hypothetical protein